MSPRRFARIAEKLHPHGSPLRRAFTLIDVMIVVLIISILAAAVLPLVAHYLDDAEEAAAETTFDSVRTALDLYYQENQAWPEEITADLFTRNMMPDIPDGWSLDYDAQTGELALVQPDP